MTRDGAAQTVTTPESGTVTYTYNPNGTLRQKADAKGQRIVYGYEPLNRLSSIGRYPAGWGIPDERPQRNGAFSKAIAP